MLSRIAEALFWIGRYVERADGTARILDVHLQLLLEDPWADEESVCRGVLSVMGVPDAAGGNPRRGDALRALATDRTQPVSVAHSLSSARENARRAREVISQDLWEVLNTTNARLPLRVDFERSHSFFQWVRERAALTYGVAETSMSRDEAWYFFVLGRALEAADMTARLLVSAARADGGSTINWMTLLRSCDAYDAHLRVHRAMPTATSATEFLLIDRHFPRSVLSSVIRAEESLRRIGQSSPLLPPDAVGRAIGRLRSELEYRPVADLVLLLESSMRHVQESVSAISNAVQDQYFPSIAAPVWTEETL